MDRRTLLAITLCFLIFIGWQKFYMEPQIAAQRASALNGAAPANPSVSNAPAAPNATNSQPVPMPSARPAQTLAVPSQTGEAKLGDGAELLTGWNLNSYKLDIAPEAAAVHLRSVTNQEGEIEFAADDPEYAHLPKAQGTLVQIPGGARWSYEDAKIKLTREILAKPDQPWLDVTYQAEFKSRPPRWAFVSLGSQGLEKDPEERDRILMAWSAGSASRFPVAKSIELKELASPVKYISAENRYFVLAAVNRGSVEPKGLVQPTGPKAGRLSMVYPVSGNTLNIPLRVYFGPKELGLLREVEPTLDHTVDFGMFTVIAYPLLNLLKWLYQFVRNYGVAIILLTALLKLLTYPLTYKSMKSMREMARLQPQLQKIREKYKDDKEALNRETLTLMRTHGYNPVAGCLPILIQMPIFFALYQVLYGSIELYHTPFALWIKDLSFHDPFYVTPVLLSLTMFIQQRLTPNTATDPAQQKMMQFMPLIFGAFMISLPAGLTLYMLTNALASIVQQLILNKKLGISHATAVPSVVK